MFRALVFVTLAALVTPFTQPGKVMAQYVAETSAADYVGVWRKDVADTRSNATTILVLRADGTYTKTLKAVVDGRQYGGTHNGSWTAQGAVVRLSGDGNWPASSEDLRLYRKAE